MNEFGTVAGCYSANQFSFNNSFQSSNELFSVFKSNNAEFISVRSVLYMCCSLVVIQQYLTMICLKLNQTETDRNIAQPKLKHTFFAYGDVFP